MSIAPRYSALVAKMKTIPQLWLLSDERNDGVLEDALRSLPRGSGFVFRHYHLGDPRRWERFQQLHRVARARCHLVIIADSALTARDWGADGIYGAPRALYPRRRDLLQIATVHDMTEIGLANRFGADAVMLSPAFPTRSHPGAPSLRPARFRCLAAHARAPVIALGGMTESNARRLNWEHWAAIDGLS